MSYFLSSENLESNKEITLTGEEAAHILLARRAKPGEKFNLQDPKGHRFEALVIKADKKNLVLKVLEAIKVPKEPSLNIVLFQAMVSESALDNILQKTTELGVKKIVLFNSENTATVFDDERLSKKLPRWNKILLEAAKQSDRQNKPLLVFCPKVELLDKEVRTLDKVFLMDKNGRGNFYEYHKQKLNSLGIIIGPEGGFGNNEFNNLIHFKNISIVKAGPRILRADTAAIAAAAVAQSIFGDM